MSPRPGGLAVLQGADAGQSAVGLDGYEQLNGTAVAVRRGSAQDHGAGLARAHGAIGRLGEFAAEQWVG